jgi:hypothetical protein
MNMRKKLEKKLALVMALVFLLPLFWNQNATVASAAAAPALSKTKLEITGAGETYQLEVLNQVAKSTYSWSSSDTKVAKVSSKGLVTTVGKGTANIKCKITYPSKKTKTLYSKVTVTIPATSIKIINAVEVNGAHMLQTGDSFNFENELLPTGTSDKTFWSIGGGDPQCIKIDNSTEGIVTALKPGKVILVASAVKNATQDDAAKSIINDAIIIEVVGPSSTVRSADITNSTEIKVIFDSAIDKSTVIGVNNKLINIEVTQRKDVKGVLSQDPGDLTASLSADMKTLIITSTNMFNGDYGINVTKNVKTTSGVALEEYYKQLSYMDNTPPTIAGVTLDDTGMIATILFTEAIDFTSLKVSNAVIIPTSGYSTNADPSTISTLNNKLNYVVNADKKSLTINLSKISPLDYGKSFSITISGIKDLSGNTPANYTLTAILRTDTSPKPQARPLYIIRTSYYTLTATFDRAIKTPGWVTINGGSIATGSIDPNDSKKVNYTLTENDAQLTGSRKVSIGFWDSYNVISTDTSASQMKEFPVDFTIDKTSPVLLSYEFDAASGVLSLTYNKNVTLVSSTGIFSTILTTISDEIRSGTNINYTLMPSTDTKVIKLKMSNMTLLGTYAFSLDQGFVIDSFKNMSMSRAISISNASGTTGELPGPYLITQSPSNLSQIYLEFASMLDVVSAQTVSNYKIPGVTILSAQVTKNTKDNGATVVLTVADGSIDITVERPISITGVMGYNGSYAAITSFTSTVELKDNKKPYYIDPAAFDKVSKNVIQLNFNEPIQGTMTVKVTQFGSIPIEYTNTVTVQGNSVYINLSTIPVNNSYLRIDVLTNNITDLSGNAATMTTTLGVMASY